MSNSETLVYYTRTGKKYFKESCGHLHSSKIETTLGKLTEKYDACSTCRPPYLKESTFSEGSTIATENSLFGNLSRISSSNSSVINQINNNNNNNKLERNLLVRGNSSNSSVSRNNLGTVDDLKKFEVKMKEYCHSKLEEKDKILKKQIQDLELKYEKKISYLKNELAESKFLIEALQEENRNNKLEKENVANIQILELKNKVEIEKLVNDSYKVDTFKIIVHLEERLSSNEENLIKTNLKINSNLEKINIVKRGFEVLEINQNKTNEYLNLFSSNCFNIFDCQPKHKYKREGEKINNANNINNNEFIPITQTKLNIDETKVSTSIINTNHKITKSRKLKFNRLKY